MRDTVHRRDERSVRPFHILMAVLVVFVAGAVGSAVTLPNISTWYRALAKPWWTPPDAAFGPAWTTLYLLMGYAFYRVLGLGRDMPGRTAAIGVFLLHMALNAGWSAAFFGGRSPAAGLAELALFWPIAVLNAVLFHRVDRFAGLLMVPNIFWVTFAAALNFAVWRMN